MVNRILVSIVLVPLGVGIIWLGGLPYALVVTAILGLAAWEYSRLMRMAALLPAAWIVIGGTALITLSRYYLPLSGTAALFSLFVLVAMTVHLLSYERGCDRAATDFATTLAGMVYLGWIGSYLVALRTLPEGVWWVLTVLPAVWMGDAGAMFIGIGFGRHPFFPRLSPRKTWEGYIGGVICGTLGGALLGALWGLVTPELTFLRGALLGLALSVLTPLGDLGESMLKRQVGAKDSSQIIPGHGGILDRIDSWLWAGVIGYYMIVVLM